jgi:energy-coupling factor transporter transmembrane protein EcfT
MRNGIPIAYATYRVVWTLVHVALVLFAAIAFVAWFVQDNHGGDVISSFWSGLVAVQSAIAGAVPFPWGPWN